MKKHLNFILTPITSVFEEAILATKGLDHRIETYVLNQYIMESLFLKATGFQEQKLKCIHWQLAVNNYEYRFQLLQKNSHEFSNYSDKNKLFNSLIDEFNYHCDQQIQPAQLLSGISDLKKDLLELFEPSIISIWNGKQIDFFRDSFTGIASEHFFAVNSKKYCLLSEYTKATIYEKLYRHRNRCAHNTLSYQENLPSLGVLNQENYNYENYFIWFYILAGIDRLFIDIYKNYLVEIDSYVGQ